MLHVWDVDVSGPALVSSCGLWQSVSELQMQTSTAVRWHVVTSGGWTALLLQAHLNLLGNLAQAGDRGGI